jgi:hypothetical protein
VSRQTNINGQHFEAAPKRSVSHALLLSLLVMGTSIGFCEGTSFPQGEAPPLEFELAWSTNAGKRYRLDR